MAGQANIGRFGYAARADLAPEAQAIDPQFTQSIPMPSAALGINARAGYRYTSEYDISPVTGPLRTGIGYLSDAWDGYVNAWNDLQEAVHGTRPDGPRR